MPPSQQPVGSQPAPQSQPAPTEPIVPTNIEPTPGPFEFGMVGDQPATPTTPAPAPAPAAGDDVPAWAKEFMTSIDERFTGLESTLTPPQPAPGAPVGSTAPQPTGSELAARNPQSWEDVDRYVNEQIQKGVQAGIQGFQEQSAAAVQADNQAKEEVNRELDTAEKDLERNGLLPPIQNPSDRNDPGKVARRELYGAAVRLNTTDLNAVATMYLKPLHDKGQMYDHETGSVITANAPQPGATSPIGSSSASTGVSGGGPDYKTIRQARSFNELRDRAGM